MKSLLSRDLAELLFEGFFIQRWNDRLRPIPLVETDKNSNKMILCLFVGKYLEARGEDINWVELADKAIFDFLIKIALKDISSVFHAELRKDRQVYATSINKVIDKQYSRLFDDQAFLEKFKSYVNLEREEKLTKEDLIIRLCHNIAVKQEFRIVEAMGYGSVFLDHEHGEETINANIRKVSKELNLEKYIESNEFGLIKQLIDRLRYQIRWSQTPRVPATNVLGHSFYVASIAYFASKQQLTEIRTANNFFAALMHDFLEALTRDIISPVKNSSPEFKAQVGRIELEMLNTHLIPKFDASYARHIQFLLTDEFSNRALVDGQITNYNTEKDITNDNSYIDGGIIYASDLFAALLEAHQSISLGISSHHLVGAVARLYSLISPMKDKFTEDTKDIHSVFLDLYDDFISK